MVFMSDQLVSAKARRTLNVIDNCYRERLGIEADLSLPAARVVRVPDQIIEWRGKPAALLCDSGPEYISQALADWAREKRITLTCIQPGKPAQNVYIERLHRTARHEWLDLHELTSVAHTQLLATQWLW